jgi:hypothetical protein
VPDVVIENPILHLPYAERKLHSAFDDSGKTPEAGKQRDLGCREITDQLGAANAPGANLGQGVTA